MSMAIIGLRLLACMLVIVWAAFSAFTFWLFGMESKALSNVCIGMALTWMLHPLPDDVAAFAEFQRQRLEDDDA
jgi:hypothetical protein